MSDSEEARKYALQLMERKDVLQAELNTQYDILSTNKATMNTPLVDPEGFPRAGTCLVIRSVFSV